jgi:hypothetical protein
LTHMAARPRWFTDMKDADFAVTFLRVPAVG